MIFTERNDIMPVSQKEYGEMVKKASPNSKSVRTDDGRQGM